MPTPKGGADIESVTQDTDDTEKSRKTPPVNPRDALIEGFAAKVSARHVEEQAEAKANGLPGTAEETEAEGETPDESGAKEQVPAAKAEPADKEVPGAVEDPLAGFVVKQDGKLVVKLKVDGVERTISTDEARAMLQKNVAADARLQEAARLRRDLDTRAAAIQAQEADLKQREAKLKLQPPPVDAGDPDLDADAEGLANALLTGTAQEVTAKVKTVLTKTRQAIKAPEIDKKQLVTEVVQTVNASQRADAMKVQIQTDLQKFETDFPEIKADNKLNALADAISDDVKTEHPDWSLSQILAETGNRTREFVKAKAPTPPPPVNRQARKEQLRPMPQSRAGTPPAKEEERPTTPAQTLAEIRKSRGQAA